MSMHSRVLRCLPRLTALAAALVLIFAVSVSDSFAATEKVTISNGEVYVYGSHSEDHVTHRWVTHINGEPIDTGDVPGGKSNVYCVQPRTTGPSAGTYNVTIIDDDDTGKLAKMRKMIYYLPGSYGHKKVTKKRWFGSKNTTGTSDFALGHLALSYIYSGNNDDKVFAGTLYSPIKAKVKSMIADLSDLDDPPANYEVFWVKNTGKQDLFGAFYDTEYGKGKVKKVSSLPLITDDNPNYSLEGAKYTLYEDAACKTAVKTRSGDTAVMTIKADGTSNTVEVEAGEYYMKETKAPKGYALDTDVHSIEIREDKTTAYSATDKPKSNPVSLLIQKADKETGMPKPQGGASLAGAEYEVSFYAVVPPDGKTGDELASAVSGKSPAKIDGKDAVWVFRTDESGRVDMSDPDNYLVKEKSAAFYRDSSGKAVFPLGVISVKETKAPEGYELDSRTYYAAITDSGDAESLSTLKTFTEDATLKEQVIRGDLKFKKSAEGRRRMGGVLFRLTSLTTGETHVLVTDKNGYASTSTEWNPHSSNTNAGETDRDGVWFNGYNDESQGAKADDSKGALPYDTYKMEELRCEANKGYELFTDEITIERPNVVVDLGTYDDEKTPEPVIETSARDDESGSKKAVADSSVIIVDEISYKGVPAGKTYVMEGILMDKASGEPIIDEGGSEVKGSTEFYAEKPDGSIEVRFEMDASSLGGRETVVFEYLKQDGELVAAHADINNKKQTVKLEEAPKPEISTDARDGESDSGKAEADKDVWIIDAVEYKNLTPGETYLLNGILMDKETGKALPDDSGKEIRSAAEFTPKTASGMIEMSFHFSGESLAGKDAVVFEYLYLKTSGKQVASHADIKSKKQTVRLVGPKETPADPGKPTKSPKTGDPRSQILYCLTAMAAALEMAVLTLRRRNDRLNRGE